MKERKEEKKKKDFLNPAYYENRELSWLKFNRRILNEARDTKNNPLMERLNFLAITSSNLDEFFMVRVASLKDMVHAGYTKRDIAGMTAEEQLTRVNEETRKFVKDQYSTYNRALTPALHEEGIRIIDAWEDLDSAQAAFIDRYFDREIYPVLTPMAVDASRPFPLVRNKTLNIAALIRQREAGLTGKAPAGQLEFATVQVPGGLPRLIPVPDENGIAYCLLEQAIEKNIGKLYLNYDVIQASPYRIMRNADFSIDEDDAVDLLSEIQKQLKKRQWGEVIRLEAEKGMPEELLRELVDRFEITDREVFQISGPLDLTFLGKVPKPAGRDDLYFEKYVPCLNPRITPGEDLFAEIRKGDIFLMHPYETFDPVVDFIRQGATDPGVLAIKQTLYRVSGNSPIVAALAKAAENGKQVTVLVELKARFDEENNIVWAKKLEKAGCHVIYGVVGLKTHCKIALIVRREEDGIRRYVHLGTGNYNDITARHYTDCGMFTCSESYGEDATAVFNMLSGYSEPRHWNRLIVAPLWMRKRFTALIERETENARKGHEALIVAKMNSLCDQKIIAKLYEASSVGVRIYLIVRGICCLRTGIPGVSENIHVSSIVGNFLEHARIFYFLNDGSEEIYMGSADWMPRNLDRRVEIVFPVEDETIRAAVKHYLDVELRDNLKAYHMNAAGEYVHPGHRGQEIIGSQNEFMREAASREKKESSPWLRRTFVPVWAKDLGDEEE